MGDRLDSLRQLGPQRPQRERDEVSRLATRGRRTGEQVSFHGAEGHGVDRLGITHRLGACHGAHGGTVFDDGSEQADQNRF